MQQGQDPHRRSGPALRRSMGVFHVSGRAARRCRYRQASGTMAQADFNTGRFDAARAQAVMGDRTRRPSVFAPAVRIGGSETVGPGGAWVGRRGQSRVGGRADSRVRGRVIAHGRRAAFFDAPLDQSAGRLAAPAHATGVPADVVAGGA